MRSGTWLFAHNEHLPQSLLERLDPADGRWLFGIGAVAASVVWFFSLGFGARRLAGLFATPLTWRVLDGMIAATMIALGISLATS